MRVTQQMLYNNYITNMNTTLSRLMDLNIQSASEKKINKPSDDPIGTARVLDHRDSLAKYEQYHKNIDTAKGWLGLSDKTLTQVSTILTRCKELAGDAASGDVTADNREQISYEVRQLFQQLISLANTEYDGKSIYGGHKVSENPFKETLWMTTNDENLAQSDFTIKGASETTILVQFVDSGTIGGAAPLEYRYSDDGGDTFTTGTLAAGATTLNLGGVTLDLEPGATVTGNDPNDTNDSSGTWIWVRPTAQYMGDDEDGVDIGKMGSNLGASADGAFDSNVTVRIDNDARLDEKIEYSYSLDGGSSWVTGNVTSNAATASNAVFSVPGGLMTISSNAGNQLNTGNIFVITPRTASIDLDIGENERIQVNDVGKDIFGGIYQDPDATGATTVFSSDSMFYSSNSGVTKNMFETVGNLIAYLETNNQQGVGECLESLKASQAHVLNSAAEVGGRENRLTVAGSVLDNLMANEEKRISSLEDVDVAALMTKLSQADVAYKAVLKTTSTIMGTSLLNYL